MRSNKSCLKTQVKIINMDNDCPRLDSSGIERRIRRLFKWGWVPGKIEIIPRIGGGSRNKTKRLKRRVSRGFQPQLGMMKSLKQHKQGKLSNQIVSSGSTSSVVSKKVMTNCGLQLRNVETSKTILIPRISGSSRNKTKRPKQKPRLLGFFQAQLRMMKSLKHHKVGKLSSNNQIVCSGTSSSKTNLIHYQFTSSGGYPILKRHRNMVDDEFRLRIHDLCEELLAEILVRLPVKDILRCRSVQKSWNYLIKSPVFIGLQLNYQKQIISGNRYPKYLLFENEDSFFDSLKDLTVRFDDLQCEEYCKLELLPGLPNEDTWFTQSYGLICMSTILSTGRDHNRNIYLWNPLIKKYKTLPESPLPSTKNWKSWEALAFGFLPQVDDYVVIHIVKPCLPLHPQSVIIGVYSFKTNSWKKSSQDNVLISGISRNHDDVVFINGAAFWAGVNSDNQRILMCFDTKTDILCEISVPDTVVPVIHQFGQSIAYFIWEEGLNHFDMWVLKYDNVNEFTWEKKMCVSPSKDVQEDVLGIRNNGDPILAKSNNLISYSLDSHQANSFVDSWDRWAPDSPYEEGYGPPYVIRPFVESLVMLND